MLDALIGYSLRHRLMVLSAAVVLVVVGLQQMNEAPIDVFPDLNRPTVTIMTEAPGLAPEEVEALVTRPIELTLNGATGVIRVRSSSTVGLSIVWVEFDWGTEIFRDRQIVAEKLQLARPQLPPETEPILAPVSSIMGEIMLLGLRSDPSARTPDEIERQGMELRTFAEFTLRNRLLGIEGVSQVSVMGGVLKQYQVLTTPARLAAQQITLEELTEATRRSNVIAGGGVMERGSRESLVRIAGAGLTLDEIGATPIVWRDSGPIRIRDVAEVRFGGPVARGAGAVWVVESRADPDSVRDSDEATDKMRVETMRVETRADDEGPGDASRVVTGGAAVIVSIQKQPGTDTTELDDRISAELDAIRAELPEGAVLESEIFRQADFIRSAIDNVTEAVRDGAIWVVVVLLLFLGNFRASVASLTSLPLSILTTLIIFRLADISINTMTLGGIAVAIGDLVDDSIVDVENIFRRLKQNRALPVHLRRDALSVVYDASREVRGSIVYATAVVILVVLPLFAMEGLEGRLFAPLGIAYVVSLLASLLVSLTVTPVLALWLLPGGKFLERPRDPLVLRLLKRVDRAVLHWTLKHARLVLAGVSCAVLLACGTVFWMGGEFLPPFSEGTLTISLRLEPGTSLMESRRIAERAERELLEIPEVVSVATRTGRAEQDEHAEGVHASEIDVRLEPQRVDRPGTWAAVARQIPFLHAFGYERSRRSRDEIVDDLRLRLTSIPGASVNIGQPISHRLDHMMSGIRAQIAVKLFGPDLRELRTAAFDVQTRMSEIDGVVDLQIEPQTEISQVRMIVDRERAAEFGLAPADIARLLETASKGTEVSRVIEEERYHSLVVWFDAAARSDPATIQETVIETPSGRSVALGQVADVLDTSGPNALLRENSRRRVVVFCNVQGRDLGSVVRDIDATLEPIRESLASLDGEYQVELSGQFEAQRQANRRLALLGTAAVCGVIVLLTQALGSWRAALQVMANVPLAALGSVVALLIMNPPPWQALEEASWWEWPAVWIGATRLSVAHWVGFITLIGIVTRNGILMISHYRHLVEHEGEVFGPEMIVRGSLERLAPVMMTAITSFVGLLPLLLGGEDTGKEILHPLAVVVFGGMIASTALDQIVTPALFLLYGRRVVEPESRS